MLRLGWLDSVEQTDSGPGKNDLASTSSNAEQRTFPVLPVFEIPKMLNRESWKPCGVWVSRFSRFSRLKNEGVQEAEGENVLIGLEHVPDTLGDLVSFLAPILEPGDVAHLHELAAEDPGQVYLICWQILLAPPLPSLSDIEELNALISRLCDLLPWVDETTKAETVAWRLHLAPVVVPEWIERFRARLNELEPSHAPAAGVAPAG